MSEGEPQAETLETIELHGRSLKAWYEWLTHDDDGEYTGHLRVPCSRYGNNGEECAYWAIAAECVYVHANGEDDEPESSLDYLMGLTVNDHESILMLVRDYWYCLPDALKQYLDLEGIEHE